MAEKTEVSMESLEEQTEEMDANSEESSSDDDTDEEDAKEQQRTEKITHLEAQVAANPFMYDPHVALIKVLREAGELQLLRRARERMSQTFPLTEELWLDWLQDEEKLASSDAERDALNILFERAVRDYLSVDVWLEYAQFSIGRMGQKDGASNVRAIFERALTACGLHVSRGSMIWDAYREFENIMVATIQPAPGGVLTEAQQEELTQQKNRVANLFKRQLGIPLMDMDKTLQEYKDWAEEPNPLIEQGYQKAWNKLQKIQPFEEALLVAEPPRFEAYQSYLEFERIEGDPTRIQSLFERALVENCLQPEMWKKYTKYLETQLKISTVSLPVFERAVRNCPWSVTLWQAYIQAMERYEQPHEKIKELVDRALGAGFTQADEFRQLWITFLDYLRRRISWKGENAQELEELRSTFLRAHNQLVECFGQNADPLGTILQYWARIEARYCKNLEKARELWSEVMALGNGTSSQMWTEYLNLERCCGGDEKQMRKMFQKALQSTLDWPEVIGDAWLNYEREEGTLETWEAAAAKCEARLLAMEGRRAKVAQQETGRQERGGQQRKGEQKTPRQERRSNSRQQAKEQSRPQKRKADEGPPDRNSSERKKSRPTSVDGDGFKIPTTPSSGKWENLTASKAAEDGDEPVAENQKSESSDAKAVPHDPSKDEFTAFLSNLAYTVKEEDIKEAFSKVGEIKELRLVRDYKGRSKGYCYVQFSSKEEAKEALKKDRELVNGRPMYVSPCQDRKQSQQAQQQKFKYQTGLEKCKLFVKGLPFGATKEQLTDIFKVHGELKDVRVVTYKSGRGKGIAFVEYAAEAAASMALMKTDGTTIGAHTISVALSNPPDRKGPQGAQNIASLGGGPKEVGLRGRGRTQVSLVPRSVQKSQSGASATKSSDANSVNGSENGSDKPVSKPMSNEDFRNMLLNK